MTVALTAGYFFYGHQRRALSFLIDYGYMGYPISESRFNRKLHLIPEEAWHTLFAALAQYFKENHDTDEYVADSFPVPVCDNIRIFKSKLISGEEFRGYTASKKRYFYGYKIHMVATTNQEPIELVMTPGSESDMRAFKRFELALPDESVIYTDKAYTDYEHEDLLKEAKINLIAQRKANAKRQHSRPLRYIQNYFRKRIETTFSRITSLFPKSIHAVTQRGFQLKIMLFILAYSISLVT